MINYYIEQRSKQRRSWLRILRILIGNGGCITIYKRFVRNSVLSDKTREKLKWFFESNEVKMEIIQEIKILLSNDNFKNKRLLVELKK